MLKSSINDSEGQSMKQTQKHVYVFRRSRDLLQSVFIWIIFDKKYNIYGVNVSCKRQLLSVTVFFKLCWSHSCSLLICLKFFNFSLYKSQGKELGKILSFATSYSFWAVLWPSHQDTTQPQPDPSLQELLSVFLQLGWLQILLNMSWDMHVPAGEDTRKWKCEESMEAKAIYNKELLSGGDWGPAYGEVSGDMVMQHSVKTYT